MLRKNAFKLYENFISIKYILIRYFLYGIALIESFTLPKLLDKYDYSQYEYFKNLIFIFPYFLLGAHSGYVQLKYVYKVDYYKQLFSIGLIHVISFSIIFSLFFQNFYILIPLIVIGIYTITEQYLKINRKFTIIFLFKPILSLITVGIAAFLIFSKAINIGFNILLLLSFISAFIIWIFLCSERNHIFPLQSIKYIRRFTLYRYTYMIKIYFTGVLTSLLFSIIIFFERYFTEKYYPENLATYSFAFNLSQIVVMVLSAVIYITTVELGERKDKINKEKLKKQFIKATISYVLFLIIFTIFVYFISAFYSEFDSLIKITLLITYAKGFFFLIGTISPLANYFGYNTYMFKYLSLLFIIQIIISFFLQYLKISYIIILFIDSLILLIYGLILLNIVFNKIQFNTVVNK